MRRMRLRMFALGASLVLASPLITPSAAQDLPAGRPREMGRDRQALERRFRERVGAVVRDRLSLNDAQMRELETANRTFEQQRFALVRREREIRMSLRSELTADDQANQDKVAQLLDGMIRIQRQRLALHEEEQRELSRFLTPVQRAKYFGLQEQVRRRMEEMRNDMDAGQKDGAARRQRRPAGDAGAIPPR